MGYADGRVFWEPHMPQSNPAERRSVYDGMSATLARLRSSKPAAIGLGDFGRGENYVARQIDRWSKQYRASETEKIEEMDELMQWLPAHVPPPGPVAVVHGDYRLDNMVLHPTEPNILAVLDWELSTLGDPLAAFTYHLMQRDLPSLDGPGSHSLRGLALPALGIPSRDPHDARHIEPSGRDPR